MMGLWRVSTRAVRTGKFRVGEEVEKVLLQQSNFKALIEFMCLWSERLQWFLLFVLNFKNGFKIELNSQM